MIKKTLLIMCLWVPLNAGATVFHDPVNFIVNLLNSMENTISKAQAQITNSQLMVQTKRQLDTINTIKLQISQAQQNYESITGSSGYGQYLEGPLVALDPSQTPKTFDELMWVMRDVGTGASGNFGGRVNTYMENNPYYDTSRYKTSFPDDPAINDWNNQKNNSAVTATIAKDNYKSAEHHYGQLKKMQRKIDEADTLKSSLDLNNRMLSEIGYLLSSSLRVDSSSAHMEAQQVQKQFNKEAKERGFMQYQPRIYKVVK